MTEPTTTTNGAASQGPGHRETASFTNWVQEVRQDSSVPPPAPPPPPSFMRRHRRAIGVSIGLVGAAIVGAAWAQYFSDRPTGSVMGTLHDPWHRPVAGARVFVASKPDIRSTSNRTGDFFLYHVPVGEQALLVVLEDRGEEYPVTIEPNQTAYLGTLIYRVPPLRFRMAHGDGVEWDGKD